MAKPAIAGHLMEYLGEIGIPSSATLDGNMLTQHTHGHPNMVLQLARTHEMFKSGQLIAEISVFSNPVGRIVKIKPLPAETIRDLLALKAKLPKKLRKGEDVSFCGSVKEYNLERRTAKVVFMNHFKKVLLKHLGISEDHPKADYLWSLTLEFSPKHKDLANVNANMFMLAKLML